MATVYDDHTVDGEFSRVSWHPALPLLAAVDEQRSVQILTASSVDKAGVVEASAAGTQSLRSVVAWHPHKAVLAVCWASGRMVVRWHFA